MKKRPFKCSGTIYLGVLLLLPVNVLAADSRELGVANYTPAKLIEKSKPHYPMGARVARDGAWMYLHYEIDENGVVGKISVLDSYGRKKFIDVMKKALSKRKYEPAMKDGVPIRSYQMLNQSFGIIDKVNGASKKFYKRFLKFEELLGEGQFTEAEKLLLKMEKRGSENFYEEAYVNLGRYYLLEKMQGHYSKRVFHLTKAVDWIGRKKMFSRIKYYNGWRSLFASHNNMQNFPEALLASYELQRLRPGGREDEWIISKIREISNFLLGDMPFSHQALIPPTGIYLTSLLKPKISLSVTNGLLEKSKIECRKDGVWYISLEYDINSQEEYELPQDADICRIWVFGEPDSKLEIRHSGLGMLSL